MRVAEREILGRERDHAPWKRHNWLCGVCSVGLGTSPCQRGQEAARTSALAEDKKPRPLRIRPSPAGSIVPSWGDQGSASTFLACRTVRVPSLTPV